MPAAGRLRRAPLRGRGNPCRRRGVRRTREPDGRLARERRHQHRDSGVDRGIGTAPADRARPEVIAALTRARQVQLIEPDERGHGWLRFRHNLTREAIISGLLPPDLGRCSAAAAAAIEAAHPGLPGAWCERTAELYGAAQLHAQAALLLLEAGRRALFQGALCSATQTLGAARSELRRVKSADPMLAGDIDEALAKALSLIGDFHRLTPVAEEA